MPTYTTAELSAISARLVDEFDPLQIVYFKKHTDFKIDLLVILATSSERLVQRAARAYRCLNGIHHPKNIWVYTESEVQNYRFERVSLEKYIREEGEVLYRQAG
ncbi:MAG: hypothetical protein D6675_16285 [Gemmatimonadetes bacterium]|nr:MAG: hypothetical protein D6675_16285 [Gemmatimonadota bacterium]